MNTTIIFLVHFRFSCLKFSLNKSLQKKSSPGAIHFPIKGVLVKNHSGVLE